jgi:hypothetical protein
VPEVTAAVRKFDGNFPSATLFRSDVHDAAFAFFFGKAVDDGHLLATLYTRPHLKESTV